MVWGEKLQAIFYIFENEMLKKSIIIVSVVVAIIVVFIIVTTPWNDIYFSKQIIKKCKEYSNEELIFDSANVNREKNNITVVFYFSDHISQEGKKTIGEIYAELYEMIYENKLYYDFTLDILFQDNATGKKVNFFEITKDKSKIRLLCDVYPNELTIMELAQICPEVSFLYVIDLRYDSLKEFDSFNELKELYCYNDIIDIDEKIYIQSLFPNCELDWQGKED